MWTTFAALLKASDVAFEGCSPWIWTNPSIATVVIRLCCKQRARFCSWASGSQGSCRQLLSTFQTPGPSAKIEVFWGLVSKWGKTGEGDQHSHMVLCHSNVRVVLICHGEGSWVKSWGSPILIYGYKLLAVTERTWLSIQAAEFPPQGVLDSPLAIGCRAEPLLLCIERSQLRWLKHLVRMS